MTTSSEESTKGGVKIACTENENEVDKVLFVRPLIVTYALFTGDVSNLY